MYRKSLEDKERTILERKRKLQESIGGRLSFNRPLQRYLPTWKYRLEYDFKPVSHPVSPPPTLKQVHPLAFFLNETLFIVIEDRCAILLSFNSFLRNSRQFHNASGPFILVSLSTMAYILFSQCLFQEFAQGEGVEGANI